MAYSFYTPLVIDHTKVSGSNTDFPVYLNSTIANLKTVANSGHVQNGKDLAFFSDTGLTTALPFEIESYNTASGALVAYVKVPSVTSGADVTIYVGYGDAGVTATQENASGVWSNGFTAVYHFEKTGSLSYVDSTGNGNSITPSPAPPVISTPGLVGGSINFVTGNNTSGSIAASPSLNLSSSMTLEAWVFSADINNDQAILVKDRNWQLKKDSSGFPSFHYWDGTDETWFRTSNYFPQGGPAGYIGAVVSSNVIEQLYRDGAPAAVQSTGVFNSSQARVFTNNVGMAAYTDGTGPFPGMLDEVRISNVARDGGWVWTTFQNQNSPSTFYSVGSEGSPPPATTSGNQVVFSAAPSSRSTAVVSGTRNVVIIHP